MDDDDSPSIVLETGACNTRVGVAGEDAPKLTLPTCVGYPPEMAHLHIKAGESWKGQFTVGEEALRKKDSSLLKWPMSGGVVKDWDSVEKIWTNAFQELMVTPAEEYGGVLLCDAVTNSKDGREKMTHIMFEKFQLPNFYAASQPMLAMYGAGRTSGVTIDAGEDFIHVVPMHDGYPVLYNAQKMPIAGRAVTEAVIKALGVEGMTYEAGKEIKENVCKVSLDYEAEKTALVSEKKSYVLPDGSKVELGTEQVDPTEILFTPEKHGFDMRGLHHVVHKVIMDSEYDQREELWRNLLLVGGCSLLKGMPERLEAELGPMAPSQHTVKLTAGVERSYHAWVGGSILSSLSTFNQMWITKQEYDDSGPSIVHRKCI